VAHSTRAGVIYGIPLKVQSENLVEYETMCVEGPSSRTCELAVVMPVYNEEACIRAVVASLRDALDALRIHFVMIVINDGSRDRTGDILREMSCDERLIVVHQANKGHGPTVLSGYQQAVRRAQWVFQCDSDGEMSPDSFRDLWTKRQSYDVVLGHRQNRRQKLSRRFITIASQVVVRLLFGKGILDVNTPYRLMRSSVLQPVLECIPPDTFAPNVIISGALAYYRYRICSVPVSHRPRRTGRVSIAKWALWKGALRSFRQTLECSRKIRLSKLHDQRRVEPMRRESSQAEGAENMRPSPQVSGRPEPPQRIQEYVRPTASPDRKNDLDACSAVGDESEPHV
jgi:dolichol-phosphate mannosyltransferase